MSDATCDANIPYTTDYDYVPSLTAGIIFGALYGLSSLYLFVQGIRRRRWFLVICFGGLAESIGWICRAVAHYYPCIENVFIVQIVLLIFAPAFFSAGLYVMLATLIRVRPDKSYWKPKTYLWFFCLCDLVSLVLQSLGGALAATANTNSGARLGADIMVAGILFQVAAMTIFLYLGSTFVSRVWMPFARGIEDSKPRMFDRRTIWVSILASVMIYTRNIYRAVELIQGWSGFLISHEHYAIALDGVPMTICIWSLAYLAFVDSTYERGLGMFEFESSVTQVAVESDSKV